MAVKLRKLSGAPALISVTLGAILKTSAKLLWIYPLCHQDQRPVLGEGLSKGGNKCGRWHFPFQK